ncbi:antirestriction protein [Salmonella enterica subsp. enterica serovar Chester]|uniref:antirestriction protein n=1 Tax=Salmonella enterica TaxID=28901 RepID=UPI0003BD1968|nr:antirestriction protein [Salmonella enterica]EDL0622387.1 antirestriction protein [Salmonella enterica subsp. enterica serovar Bareilly]EDN8442078.1 antirestriction protein [Salmonella enterica subsp. enterica]APV75871.1 antirestriction protein [Salmonella enterica subsp. enterica serovar Chester str. ATCC 11997]EAV4110879.1 antirestriction protein [Salmonella enterica]EBI5331404.1 antirestriction protein [Salmonella enterica]
MTKAINPELIPAPDETLITATPVPDEDRPDFWPRHFRGVPQWILLEPRIFAWTDRLCADYSGGIWQFYTLSNGGAFMAPEADDGDDTWSLFNAMNGNSADMSPEAVGITACLLEYSHHACRTGSDLMTAHYLHLRDYTLNHPECSAIMHITD